AQPPDADQLQDILAKREKEQRQPDARELSAAEMKSLSGRGYRNKYLAGTLPWQRDLRGANLCSGNLFKSFTDIQVPPARGAGLAFQRSYNSMDDRIGPFGVGWTDSYDIHVDEAPNNKSDRADFFGARHSYQRDA